MNAFYRELLTERFGPPPTAELHRPLREECGDGGEDTPQACATRRQVLMQVNDEEESA